MSNKRIKGKIVDLARLGVERDYEKIFNNMILLLKPTKESRDYESTADPTECRIVETFYKLTDAEQYIKDLDTKNKENADALMWLSVPYHTPKKNSEGIIEYRASYTVLNGEVFYVEPNKDTDEYGVHEELTEKEQYKRDYNLYTEDYN